MYELIEQLDNELTDQRDRRPKEAAKMAPKKSVNKTTSKPAAAAKTQAAARDAKHGKSKTSATAKPANEATSTSADKRTTSTSSTISKTANKAMKTSSASTKSGQANSSRGGKTKTRTAQGASKSAQKTATIKSTASSSTKPAVETATNISASTFAKVVGPALPAASRAPKIPEPTPKQGGKGNESREKLQLQQKQKSPNNASSVAYKLRAEIRWSNGWGKSGVDQVNYDKIFATKAEAVAYAPRLISDFEVFDQEGYGDIEVDYRDDPESAPDSGCILSVVDEEGEETDVFIEMISKPQNKNKSASSSSNSAGGHGELPKKYVLRSEEHWSSGWGKSGINKNECPKTFSSVAEAVAYAPKLIDCFEVFDKENYGSIDVDYRKNPGEAPESGVILETEDMEGQVTKVIIQRVA